MCAQTSLRKYQLLDSSKASLHSFNELSLFSLKQPNSTISNEDTRPIPLRPACVPSLKNKLSYACLHYHRAKEENKKPQSMSMLPKDIQSYSEYK